MRRAAPTVKNGWCKNVLKSERFTSQAIQRQNKGKLYPIQMQWYDNNFANWQQKRDLKTQSKTQTGKVSLNVQTGLTRHTVLRAFV